MQTTDFSDRLIIALDVDSEDEALSIVDLIDHRVNFYKIGLQLFTAAGPNIVRRLVNDNKKVFLDLKLHEIPNSVSSAIRMAADLGVSMITVHASGATKMMRAAVEAAKPYPGVQILAVTVMTSLGSEDLQEVGLTGSCEDHVIRLGKLAEDAGCHGVVASAKEVSLLKKVISNKMAIVTPGIRLDNFSHHDQLRTSTPFEAIRAGASHLVIGRPITQESDPNLIVHKILDEIANGFVETKGL